MKGCGFFLLAIASLIAALTMGFAWPAYLAFGGVGCLFIMAGGQRPLPRRRHRRRM